MQILEAVRPLQNDRPRHSKPFKVHSQAVAKIFTGKEVLIAGCFHFLAFNMLHYNYKLYPFYKTLPPVADQGSYIAPILQPQKTPTARITQTALVQQGSQHHRLPPELL